MNRLPFEILKEIFILLPQRQKLECMCVCRSWDKVIKDTCLFHTISVNTHRNLDKLTRVFECTPSNEKKVKRLVLYSYYGYIIFNPINTPNLTHLTLSRYQFKYDEVEQFDQLYPLLKAVKLILVHPLDTRIPEKIKPSTRITYLHFKLKSIRIDDQSVLLRYIRKKYTNLIGFVYDSGVPALSVAPSLYYGPSFLCGMHHALVSLIVAQGSQLKRLDVLCTRFMFFQLKNSVMPFQLDELNLDLISTSLKDSPVKSTFLEPPFSQLRVLTIQFTYFNNFEWLEALNKLEVLNIKCPNFQLISVDTVMQHASETLETLLIKGCSIDVKREDHFIPPHEKSKLDQTDSSDKTSHIYSLKKLTLSHVRIRKNVDNFISHSCPGLKSLSVYDCSIDNLEFRLPDIHLLHFNIAMKKPLSVTDKNKLWEYMWTHTKEESHLWRADYFQDSYYDFRSFEFYGYPALPCPTQIPNDAFPDLGIWNFTFASVKHIGATKERK